LFGGGFEVDDFLSENIWIREVVGLFEGFVSFLLADQVCSTFASMLDLTTNIFASGGKVRKERPGRDFSN